MDERIARPRKGLSVEASNGRKRYVVKTTRTTGAEADPSQLSQHMGYNVHYSTSVGGKERMCWLSTWQSWCSRHKVVLIAS